VAHLHVARFLPDSDHNDRQQDQDQYDNGEDNQDEHGKHQLSASLLMI
jgi:hypothetical protein